MNTSPGEMAPNVEITSNRILIFDDDLGVRRALRRIFENRGYQVFPFSSPSPCSRCSCVVDEIFSYVILSDMSMPGMRGIDFLENQRRVGCKIDCFGLMSGNWEDRDRSRTQERGFRIFSKPFDIYELCRWADEGARRSKRVLVDHIFRSADMQSPKTLIEGQTDAQMLEPGHEIRRGRRMERLVE